MNCGLVLMTAIAFVGQAQARPSAVQEATAYWGKGRLTLQKGELAKFVRMGGMRGVTEEIVVRADGTVRQTITRMGKPEKGGWKLAPKEMAAIRREVAATPFRTLRSGARRDYPSAAVDGVDFLYVARQGKKVEWWSSGHWEAPAKGVKFFDRMQQLAPISGGGK